MTVDSDDQTPPADRVKRTALLTKVDIYRDDHVVGTARVRNLSQCGLGGVCDVQLTPDEEISVELTGVGRVRGQIAWVKDKTFGLRFIEDIDLAALKMPPPVLVQKPDRFTFEQRYQPIANYRRPALH